MFNWKLLLLKIDKLFNEYMKIDKTIYEKIVYLFSEKKLWKNKKESRSARTRIAINMLTTSTGRRA